VARSRAAAERVAGLYATLGCPVVIYDHYTAEMVKYASNAFLAARISFINEFANVGELVGAEIDLEELEQAAEEYGEQVTEAVASDAETASYVEELERRVDMMEAAEELPSGEALAAELQQLIADALGKPLPYNNLAQLRERMVNAAPHFAHAGGIVPAAWLPPSDAAFRISDTPLDAFITHFYMTDPISRASKTMAECTREILGQQTKRAA